MKKTELIDAMAKESGLSKKDTSAALDAFVKVHVGKGDCKSKGIITLHYQYHGEEQLHPSRKRTDFQLRTQAPH